MNDQLTDVLIMPDVANKKIYNIIGMVLGVLSLMLVLALFYGVFFSRTTYYNRKALLKWLNRNSLPVPKHIKEFTIWQLSSTLELIMVDGRWYLYDGNELKICSFTGGIIDKYRYDTIFNYLKAQKK